MSPLVNLIADKGAAGEHCGLIVIVKLMKPVAVSFARESANLQPCFLPRMLMELIKGEQASLSEVIE